MDYNLYRRWHTGDSTYSETIANVNDQIYVDQGLLNTTAYEYRITSRGGKGIANMAVSKKTGKVVSSFPVNEKDDVMLIAGTGKLIRSPVNKIRIAGRTTQGVTLFKVGLSEKVLSAASIKDLNINSEE